MMRWCRVARVTRRLPWPSAEVWTCMRENISTCARCRSITCRLSLTASGRTIFGWAPVSRSSSRISVRSPRVSKGNFRQMPSLTVRLLTLILLRHLDKLRPQFWPHTFVFLFEKDERVFPLLILDPLQPFGHIAFLVSSTPQAQISPTRSTDDFGQRFFVGVGNDQGAILLAQYAE